MLESWKAGRSKKLSLIFLAMIVSPTYTCITQELDATRAVLIAPKLKCFELILSERVVRRVSQGIADFGQTIGRKRPTSSCNRPVICPSEQTSAASTNAGK